MSELPPSGTDNGDDNGDGDSWLNKDYLYYAVLVILVILVFVLIPLFE